MKILTAKTATGLLAAILFAALPARGTTTFTVQELGINPSETPLVTISGLGTFNVYAGVNQLLVDGTQMNGFCIDPFHFSLPSSPGYSYVALANAPKGNTMGATTALDIRRLWGSYYSSALTSATVAAGLQIAIWELVGGNRFHLLSGNDYGASTFISAVTSATYSGPVADLIGLTGPGQDYVVAGILPNDGAADGGMTLILLGLALSGLALFRRAVRTA